MKKQEITRTLKFLGWIALVLVIIGVIMAAIKKKSVAKTKVVKINIEPLPYGKNLLTKGDVLAELNKSFGYSLEGLQHKEVEVERVERVLEKYPFVLDADVFIDAENSVQIDIQQRIPILRIYDKMELSYYLDWEGNKLPISKNYSPRLLIASGNIPPFIPDFQERENHLLKATFDLANKILANTFLLPLVEQIYINNKNEFILIPKLGKQKILLGEYEYIENKLYNLEIFYKKALPKEGWTKHKTLDLRFKDQVVGVR